MIECVCSKRFKTLTWFKKHAEKCWYHTKGKLTWQEMGDVKGTLVGVITKENGERVWV